MPLNTPANPRIAFQITYKVTAANGDATYSDVVVTAPSMSAAVLHCENQGWECVNVLSLLEGGPCIQL